MTGAHEASAYIDIAGGMLHCLFPASLPNSSVEWLSSEDDDMITWVIHEVNASILHQIDLQNPISFGTKGGQPTDATVWHATAVAVRLAPAAICSGT